MHQHHPHHILQQLTHLLLQLLLHPQIPQDHPYFSIHHLIHHLTQKIIPPHPHLFPHTRLAQPSHLLPISLKFNHHLKPHPP
ncbi:MazG nucleotide pyrophosphohydrolase domain-containing protein, partial [Bacillus altitudinis]|uniref:MazG nucleotide pyrophosphohydrolase domain-containing protein n=1 Tax=Bacillus altitudinis TaxID=293387 RepID=UPI003B52BA2A